LVPSIRQPPWKQHTEAFTNNGEMEDKSGNKRIDTWTRVSAPMEEWFRYTADNPHDGFQSHLGLDDNMPILMVILHRKFKITSSI
jgi:hypothetical protein